MESLQEPETIQLIEDMGSIKKHNRCLEVFEGLEGTLYYLVLLWETKQGILGKQRKLLAEM